MKTLNFGTVKEFRINARLARKIAELLWGKGGTTVKKTNREGVYYFDCSRHGGYIVDHKAITEAEKKAIEAEVKPQNLRVLIEDNLFVRGITFREFNRDYVKLQEKFAHEGVEVEWKDYAVYTFEQDEEYMVLERLTNIKLV